jgi:hypothetical protein
VHFLKIYIPTTATVKNLCFFFLVLQEEKERERERYIGGKPIIHLQK